MGQKNLAVLTGDRINEEFFDKKMYGRSTGRSKIVAVITRWPNYQGGRKAGFRCSKSSLFSTPQAPTKIREDNFNLKKLHLLKKIIITRKVLY